MMRILHKKRRVFLGLLLAVMFLIVFAPESHAADNVHTYQLGSSTVGSCSGKCENLVTTTGTSDTGTSQSLNMSAAPVIDSNTNSKKSGTWSTGTTFTITGLSTTSTNDVIMLWVDVRNNVQTAITISSASTSGIVWQSSSRKSVNQCTSKDITLSEMWGVAAAALSSVTTTVTLSGTPNPSADGFVIAVSGADTVNPFDSNAGFPYSALSASCNSSSAVTVASVSSTNANDLFFASVGNGNLVTETVSTIGGTTATLDFATAITGIEHLGVSAVLSASSCNFGTSTTAWGTICDALVAPQKYYIVRPDVASSKNSGTEASTPQGNAWVLDTDLAFGGSTNVQSGKWAFNVTTTAGAATAGTAFIQIQVFSCTTHSLGTCTLLFSNLDTATNILGTTTATKRTYATGIIGPFNNVHFLSVEYWINIRDLASSTTISMTETTVSAAGSGGSNVQTPGYDTTLPLTGSVTIANTVVRKITLTGVFAQTITIANNAYATYTAAGGHAAYTKVVTAALTFANTVILRLSLSRVLTAALTFANAVISKIFLTKILTQTVTIANAVFSRISLTKVLTQTVTVANAIFLKQSLSRILTALLTLSNTVFSKIAVSRVVTAAITISNAIVRVWGYFRVPTASITFANAIFLKLSLSRVLTGLLTFSNAVYRVASVSRVLTTTITFTNQAFSKVTLVRLAISSITFANQVILKLTLSRVLIATLTFSNVVFRTISVIRVVTAAITFVNAVFAKLTLTRVVTSALTFANSAILKLSLSRVLTASLTFSNAVFRGVIAVLRVPTAAITFANQAVIRLSLSRILTGSITFSNAVFRTIILTRVVTGSLSFGNLVIAGKVFSKVVTQLITFSNVVVLKRTLSRVLQQTIIFGNVVFRFVTLTRVLTGSLNFGNLVVGGKVFVRILTQTIVFSNVAIFRVALSRIVLSPLSLLASAFATYTPFGVQNYVRVVTQNLTFVQSVIQNFIQNSGSIPVRFYQLTVYVFSQGFDGSMTVLSGVKVLVVDVASGQSYILQTDLTGQAYLALHANVQYKIIVGDQVQYVTLTGDRRTMFTMGQQNGILGWLYANILFVVTLCAAAGVSLFALTMRGRRKGNGVTLRFRKKRAVRVVRRRTVG